jgi:hypothetical protein
MEYQTLKRLLAAFESHGVIYAIFGAVALNLHGIARFTEDLDVFVAPDVSNIDRLKHALRSVVDDPDIDTITAEDLLGRYPALQYVPPDGSFHIDILTRLGEAFSFSDLELARVPFDDLTVTVVTPKTLYGMKRDTMRLQDRADAELLKRRFKLESD